MNTLKRTLALVATLAMAATAFASCGDDKDSSSSSSSSSEASKVEESSEDTSEDSSDAQDTTKAEESTGEIADSVGKGGDTFTIAAWNADDVPFLIAQWKGLDYDSIQAMTSMFTSVKLTGLSSTSTMTRRHFLLLTSVLAILTSLTSTLTQMRSVSPQTAFVRAFHGRLQQAASSTDPTSLRSTSV